MKTPVQKFNLRLPVPMIEEAKTQADALGVSLNAFVLQAVAAHVERTRKQLRPPAATSRKRPTSVRAPQQQRVAGAERSGRAETPGPSPAPALPLQPVGPNAPCPCGSGRKAKRCHPEACGR